MPGDEVWLVGERRPGGEQKYYVSNLPADTPIKTLVAAIRRRLEVLRGRLVLLPDPPFA